MDASRRWLKRAERVERVPRPLHIYRAIRRTASKSVVGGGRQSGMTPKSWQPRDKWHA